MSTDGGTSEFAQLALPPALLKAVQAIGYTKMTPVQAQSLPPMLEGRDVIAQARTGSGKTAAFGLGLLSRIEVGLNQVQALVLCPTRELADQVANAIRRLASTTPNLKLLTLTGGRSVGPQLASLAHVPQIVVGTPGRLQDHLRKSTLDLGAIRVLVLDEADRMLDMGFEPAIRGIVSHTPGSRQTLLFSATFPPEIRAVSGWLQRDPLTVTVNEAPVSVRQRFFEIDLAQKNDLLKRLLGRYQPSSVLVFCNTRRDADSVADHLVRSGHSALALHGDLEQRERDEVLLRFAGGSCRVLVATDVAARGLDIPALPLVISYEVSPDADVHVHRVGRTGRAGAEGVALHLCSPRELARLKSIEPRVPGGIEWEKASLVEGTANSALQAPMRTLCIDRGRSDKMRRGDILGALTGDAGLSSSDVGRIDIMATRSYVPVERSKANAALSRLREHGIKGKKPRVRPIQ